MARQTTAGLWEVFVHRMLWVIGHRRLRFGRSALVDYDKNARHVNARSLESVNAYHLQ